MKAKIFNPIASLLSLTIGATITIVLEEEENVQWIHTVLVVLATCLLIDMQPEFEGKILRIVKKVVALVLGLGLGIVSGLVVRAMAQNWGCPRWSILLVRLLFVSVFILASILIFQSRILTRLRFFQGKWKIEPFHMSLLCFASALPLFSTSSSLALSRCVGVLFASAIVVIVTSAMYAIVNWRDNHSHAKTTVGRRVITQHSQLIETVIALCRCAVSTHESDKEKFDLFSFRIRKGLDGLEDTIAPAPWHKRTKTSPSRKMVNLVGSHLRTLSYECSSLFWSMMSVATSPFICVYETDEITTQHLANRSYLSTSSSSAITTDETHILQISNFANNPQIFGRYFASSIRKIDSGLCDLNDALLHELPAATSDDVRAEIVDRITSLIIGYQLVEGMQGMEFNFKQVGPHGEIFASYGQRWNMCAYLVNLGAVIVSVIDLTRTIISSYGLPEDVQDRAIVNLSDYSQKISAIQKLGSMNDLLSLSNPIGGGTGCAVSSIQPVSLNDSSSIATNE